MKRQNLLDISVPPVTFRITGYSRNIPVSGWPGHVHITGLHDEDFGTPRPDPQILPGIGVMKKVFHLFWPEGAGRAPLRVPVSRDDPVHLALSLVPREGPEKEAVPTGGHIPSIPSRLNSL
jgi:hypothetical protein